jgi:hypothetical protein
MTKIRAAYVDEVRGLAQDADASLALGRSEEQVAREVSARRRALRMHYLSLTPEPWKAQLADHSKRKYDGDPLGPTVDLLRQQGYSWRQIIDAASRPGTPPVFPNAPEAANAGGLPNPEAADG